MPFYSLAFAGVEHEQLALLRCGQVAANSSETEDAINRFGGFSLETHREELLRGSELIPLNTQGHRLIKFSAENPQRMINRNELLELCSAPSTQGFGY